MIFHSSEYDVQHLSQRCFSRGLIDEIFARQVDVVAGANGQQQSALVDLDVLRRDHRQQGFDDLQLNALVCRGTGETGADGGHYSVD